MEPFESDVPSRRRALLAALVGQRLVRMVRYSRRPADEAARVYHVPEPELFAKTAGPVALIFESGAVVGAASQPSENSVLVWLERDKNGTSRSEPLDQDTELYPVSADDPRYSDARWAAACGAVVRAIRVFERVGQDLTRTDLPNETAVQFELDNGDSFFLGHGLHDDSDDFAVVHEEEIEPEIKPTLRGLFTLEATA
jgi:hypothetical protein